MAPPDPYEELPDVDDKSNDSSDEDFNPLAAAADPAEDSSSSSSEDDATATTTQRSRKRKAPAPEDFDSGDEVTIEAARKRKAKRRKGAQDGDEDDIILSDDEGGEGGLVKTRAQRRVEGKERKPLAGIQGATIDVDALWAQISAAPLRRTHVPLHRDLEEETSNNRSLPQKDASTAAEANEVDLVSIRKIYTFAGQRTTEEKQVPRRSLDQYITDGWKTFDAAVERPNGAEEETAENGDAPAKESARPNIRRPLRRPSRFDPNPNGYVRALPSEHQLTWPRKTADAPTAEAENMPPPEASKAQRPEKAQKLNVVDKSRLDWTGFVDKEGIAEELDVHGKTKEAYLGRMEFLAGVEAKREEERLRLKGAAAS